MARNQAPFSRHGLHPHTRVDVGALSPQARRFARVIAGGNFTQDSTVKTQGGPLGIRAKLVAAYVSYATVPAGGTLAVQLVAYDASANAEVLLTEALDPEGLTAREGAAFTLAATNPAVLEPDDTLEVHQIASDDTVSQQQAGGFVVAVLEPVEDDPIVD